MGFFSDLFSFVEDFTSNSYYAEDTKEWCDSIIKRIDNVTYAEARLIVIGDRVYKQLSVTLENDVVALFSDKKDKGCSVNTIKLSRNDKQILRDFGFIVIKKY